MALILGLPPETEQRLQTLAEESGQDLAAYALAVIERHLADHGATVTTPPRGRECHAAAHFRSNIAG